MMIIAAILAGVLPTPEAGINLRDVEGSKFQIPHTGFICSDADSGGQYMVELVHTPGARFFRVKTVAAGGVLEERALVDSPIGSMGDFWEQDRGTLVLRTADQEAQLTIFLEPNSIKRAILATKSGVNAKCLGVPPMTKAST